MRRITMVVLPLVLLLSCREASYESYPEVDSDSEEAEELDRPEIALDRDERQSGADRDQDEPLVADEPEDAPDDTDIVEEDPVEPEPEPVATLTNDDLLQMNKVVITAVISDSGTVWHSDVGRETVTTAADVSAAAGQPKGLKIMEQQMLTLQSGQVLEFCNHAQSSERLRVHASQTSAFEHWGGDQQLDPGECSTARGYPEVVDESAVGNIPGDNLYNHNQNEETSTLYLVIE